MSRLNTKWIAVLALSTLTWLIGCSSLCKDTPGGQARSPDNMIDAIATFRECGATTSDYTRVTLQPSPANHNDIEQIVFTTRYHHEVELKWIGVSELTISCPTCAAKDVELQIVKFRSVEVTYVLGPTSPAGRAPEPLTEEGFARAELDRQSPDKAI